MTLSVIRNVRVDTSKCTTVDVSVSEYEHIDTSVHEQVSVEVPGLV